MPKRIAVKNAPAPVARPSTRRRANPFSTTRGRITRGKHTGVQ